MKTAKDEKIWLARPVGSAEAISCYGSSHSILMPCKCAVLSSPMSSCVGSLPEKVVEARCDIALKVGGWW